MPDHDQGPARGPASCPVAPGDAPGPDAGPGPGAGRAANPAVAVTALYREHALGMTRFALVLIRDAQAAEDIVQEAFCGLHRRWRHLRDEDKALSYVRSAVLNGCRSEFRRRTATRRQPPDAPAWSAESAAMAIEERREVLPSFPALPSASRGGGRSHRPRKPPRAPAGERSGGWAGLLVSVRGGFFGHADADVDAG
ncbi:MAG: sigma factor [Actinomycetota bacterium]